MADKGGLTYLPGATEANVAYEEALKRLTESLDARKNRLFDPTLLAMAEGFLGPTQTGGFGEALGRAAGKVRGAVLEEEKAERDIAQAQLALAERGMGLEQQKQRERQFQEYLGRGAPGGMPAAAPQGPAQPITPQAGEARLQAAVADKPPPGMEMSVGVQVFPPTQNLMTSTSLLMQRYREGKMSLGDALAEATKLENDRYVYRDNAVLDKLTGKMYFSPTGDTVEVSTSRGPQRVPKDLVRLNNPRAIEDYVAKLPSSAELAGSEAASRAARERGESTATEPRYIMGGTRNLPRDLAFRYDQAAQKFGPESAEAMRIVGPYIGISQAAPEVAAEPGKEPKTTTGLPTTSTPGTPTVEDRSLVEKIKLMTAEDRAKYENEERRKILNAASDATQAMSRAAIFRQYADAPDADDMFGIFSNSEVSSVVGRLIEQGIGGTTPGGRFSVGIPDIQRVLRNFRLTPEQQARYQTALMLMVESQIKMSEYAKGSVSNYEQQLFQQAGINPEDVPGSIRMKADMITLRGEFEKDRAKKLRESNMTVEQLKDSDWYADRVKKYDEDLMKIASGQRLNAPGAKKQSPASPARLRWNPEKGTWE